MTPRPGHIGIAQLEVTDKDTALAIGSGDVPVLATPRLVALCEEAAVNSVKNQLDEALTSVGLAVDMKHLSPTPIGASVRAEARLEAVDGRKLTFNIRAQSGKKEIARGRLVRVVVNRAQFLARATESD